MNGPRPRRAMIQIGSRTFATKAAAERHIREMFWRYPPMGELTGEDREFVLALIAIHPSRAAIVDCGIRSIHVQPVPFHEAYQRRFLVRRTDSSIRDFAWRWALSPKSAAQNLASVLRYLAAPHIASFKEAHFRGVCAICGERTDVCEIDHAHPATFQQLMAGWLQSEHLTAADVDVVRTKGYEQNSRLEDPALARSWVEYHARHARLRALCLACHRSLRASSAEPPTKEPPDERTE